MRLNRDHRQLRHSDYEAVKPINDSISAGRLMMPVVSNFTCVGGIGLGGRLLD